MSMLIKNKILIILIVLMFASNPISSIRNTNPSTTSITEANAVVVEIPKSVSNNQEYSKEVSTSQVLIVKIQGNPTTGYGWYLDNQENLDTSVIKPLNLDEHGSTRDYQTDPHPPGFVGVPGSYFFKFQPLKAGANVNLKFIHKRPWMPNEDIKKATVNINITN